MKKKDKHEQRQRRRRRLRQQQRRHHDEESGNEQRVRDEQGFADWEKDVTYRVTRTRTLIRTENPKGSQIMADSILTTRYRANAGNSAGNSAGNRNARVSGVLLGVFGEAHDFFFTKHA